jgi:hypothetical protein
MTPVTAPPTRCRPTSFSDVQGVSEVEVSVSISDSDDLNGSSSSTARATHARARRHRPRPVTYDETNKNTSNRLVTR